jgi:hypothetical protein
MAILTAVCMAAEHNQWDTELRARTLAIVFDGMRPAQARLNSPAFPIRSREARLAARLSPPGLGPAGPLITQLCRTCPRITPSRR